ncbi:PQQ-binding-like beta-propeller repeat protein [Sphaerisporangium sp. TRM90804]|uniref:outer membrane protein assembly factor BamB family protein n=1 Tax=Sphaerisporangium sp. TRM90804 TaxID=3031113 RepID=UPI00244D0D7D|nr:PQQ-binding-like beta-propeller repeat protein [Sphaerisporangium sp. TRM90804]MDH2430866.1 PQQ-binding-like beta-propeller repeat protein [Sphaerisporangium sp. TRM90804]
MTLLGATLITAPQATAMDTPAVDWPLIGRDVTNTRANPSESRIGRDNVHRLRAKWTYKTHGDVSATPAVVAGALYFPDWGGYLNKVDAETGRGIWSRKVSDYTGNATSVSRSSPAVVGNRVYIGDWEQANLMAVDATTGALVWRIQLDTQFKAVITASPVVHNGVIYIGVSSRENELGADPTYPCCVFRGSMNAIDARTGRVLWRQYTVPANGGQPGGYSGGAVWGTPAVDVATNTVYFTTGQNYTVPQSVHDCQNAGGKPHQCYAPDNYIDTVLALDTASGRIKWNTGAMRFDAWNTACVPGLPPNNCPQNPGWDYDFGDGAHLFTIRGTDGRLRKVIGAGQKSGEYWLMDATTGAVVWSAAAGPGGHVGGIMWGTAYDGQRVYLAEANFNKTPYQIAGGTTITSGSYAALDPRTGRVLWQVPDPSAGFAWAPLTVANGVVFACSTGNQMYALDAANGRTLWQFDAPYSCMAGPAVVNGTVYWGNGYERFKYGGGTTGSTTEGTFYAFTVGGR